MKEKLEKIKQLDKTIQEFEEFISSFERDDYSLCLRYKEFPLVYGSSYPNVKKALDLGSVKTKLKDLQDELNLLLK